MRPGSDIRLWVDGVSAGAELAVSALDHGLTVGDGVFETCKVVDSQVFALGRHHDRMDASLALLGLPPLDRERMQAGINTVLAAEPIGFGRLRYTVTAGPGPLGSDRVPGETTYLVAATEIEPPARTCTIAVVPWTRNERGALTGVKSTSYAENVVALAAARRAGATEAVLANSVGDLCEGTGTNIFVVRDGVVYTPELACGPLAGITRGLCLEWLTAEGIEIVEGKMPMTVLNDAEEVWITSSIRDLTPVAELVVTGQARTPAGTVIPAPPVTPRTFSEAPGPVTRAAQEIFSRRASRPSLVVEPGEKRARVEATGD